MNNVFFVPGSANVIDYAHQLPSGLWISVHTAQTLEQLAAMYPGVIMASESEFCAQMENTLRTEPSHIDRQAFEFALHALPPQGWEQYKDAESFKFMEHYAGRVTTIYARLGRKFFRFNDVCTLTHAEIIAKVQNSAALSVPGPGPYGNCL
jgi:hypothetical protein